MMTEDRFERLSRTSPPPADEKAKAKALELAIAAFDEEEAKKRSDATQGSGEARRPMNIRNTISGWFKMDARIPVAATLSALLILPLGVMLMQSTSFTSPNFGLPQATGGNAPTDLTLQDDADGRGEARKDFAIADGEVEMDEMAVAEPEPFLLTEESAGAVSPRELMAAETPQAQNRIANDAAVSAPTASPVPVGGLVQDQMVPGYEGSGDQFEQFEDNGVVSVADAPVSTFSIDVDTASYTYMRRALQEGRLPNPDSVRIEELINYFDYDYAAPTDPSEPFLTDIEVMPSPWDAGKQVIRIGLQGYEAPAAMRDPVNLVFLLDTSGSMDAPDKLPLLKSAFRLLVDQLGADDTISIVTYAGSAGTVLEPTPASERRTILNALDRLDAGGSTAGAAGIEAAYRLAEEGETEGVTSRVILATDGDFNVGISSPDALKDLIEQKRDAGIFLSVLGFGTGNLNDAIMQSLAQNGNGTAHYIDNFREAQRVLVDEVGATLMPIASDVKVQVEFNPAEVAEYRLIGYETRALNREDFNNDRVDAGDVGAGLSVTALYEITPVGSDSVLVDPLRYGDEETSEVANSAEGELAFFKLRYKLPGENESQLYTEPVTDDMAVASIDEADEDARFALAVAAFGQVLRHNVSTGEMSFDEIRDLAAGARGEDEDGYRAEFLSLIDLAESLSDR